jgi:protein PET100
MGNWHLEVFKLGLYVSFPVAMFYIFNQAPIFEPWVVQMKRELYPPESMTGQKEIRTYIKEARGKQQAQLIKEMEQEEFLKSSFKN